MPPMVNPRRDLALLLHPTYMSRQRGFTGGIGSTAKTQNQDRINLTEITRMELREVMIHCRRARTPPLAAHHSHAAQLPKNNGKNGTKAMRLIHMLCAWWRAVYRGLWTSDKKQVAGTIIRAWSSPSPPKRRRDDNCKSDDLEAQEG